MCSSACAWRRPVDTVLEMPAITDGSWGDFAALHQQVDALQNGCTPENYFSRIAGLGIVTPSTVASIIGQSGVVERISKPSAVTRIVSSTFVPVMLGFQANAWPSCTICSQAGLAI